MSNVNYINPTALLPQIGWKPEGFMAGSQYARQENEYAQQMAMSNISQMLGIMQKQAEHTDYNANAPVREAERGYKVQDFRDRAKLSPFETGAKIEEASARGADAMPAVEHKQFQRSTEKQNVHRELVGNYLSAILNSEGSPAEKMLAWRDKAVPELERNGVKVPDEQRSMDVATMQRLSAYITENSDFRRSYLQQVLKERGMDRRNTEDNQTQLSVAELRAQAANRERQTAAQIKERERLAYVEELMVKMLNEEFGGKQASPTQADIQRIKTRAEVESHQLFNGGNPFGRAMGTAEQQGNEARIAEYRLADIRSKSRTYSKKEELASAIKEGRVAPGDYFRYDGKVYEWTGTREREIPAPYGPNSPGRQAQ